MVANATSQPWRWWHFACVLGALMLALSYAFLVPAWCDEVAYVDPGAQLALTGKMVSTAWVTNSPEALWGSSNPGMPLLFAGWFKLFGFGQVQARLLFCLLHLSGVFFLFRWIRYRFDPEPWPLVLGIVSSVLLSCLANAIFQARLESLAFLLCAWFLHYAHDDSRGLLRDCLAAIFLGLAIIFFGLHFAGFFALAAIGAFILKPGRRNFLLGVGLAFGLSVGMALLWFVFVRIGIWDTFVAARACHYGRVLEWAPVGWRQFVVTSDIPGLALLAGLGLYSAAWGSRGKPARSWAPWAGALGVFFFIPLIFGLIGIYYGNYSWMVALPMMLCFYLAAPSLTGWRRKAFVSILSLGLIVMSLKLTKRLPEAVRETQRRQQVIMALRTISPKGAAVAADFPLYYQLVGAGYRVYPRVRVDEGLCLGFEQERFLPKPARERISCVVTKEATAAAVLSGLGGEWRMSAVIPTPTGGRAGEDYQIFVRK